MQSFWLSFVADWPAIRQCRRYSIMPMFGYSHHFLLEAGTQISFRERTSKKCVTTAMHAHQTLQEQPARRRERILSWFRRMVPTLLLMLLVRTAGERERRWLSSQTFA